MAITLRPFLIQAIPIGIILSLLAISLVLLGIATNNPHETQQINAWLVPLNGLILIILSGLILYNLHQLVTRLKAREAGSRYTARLVAAFAILTIIPVLVVSFFSMNFLGDRIDTWFDVKIEGALDDSLELTSRALDVKMRQHLFDLEQVAKEMVLLEDSDDIYGMIMDRKREFLGAYEMVLFSPDNRVRIYSGDALDRVLPHLPKDDIFRTLSLQGYMYQLEPDTRDGLYSRVALTLQLGINQEPSVLTALFPFSKIEQQLAENVQLARDQYQTTSANRNQIKYSFRLTLLLIMVLSILFSILAAFLYSKKLTEPIRKLLDGTVAVASGNLYKKLPVSKKDDFSLLARSFNAMTSRLAEASKESEESQRQIQQQRDYLDIVLNHINSGVMTIDKDGVIHRSNAALDQVLQISFNQYIGKTFEEVCKVQESLRPLYDVMSPYLQNNETEWQVEFNLPASTGQQSLVCRGAKLPGLLDGAQGHVVVIDDITDMIQAEHDAAWSEVARRLAHEIKNPLTPIQLSAERLQFKLLPELSDKSAELLQRMSKTIISQVDNMKTMVDAFSQYAHTPEIKFQQVKINTLIQEIAELYRENSQHAEIVLTLTGVPDVYVDANRIRQMLVNLFKNALEAMPEEQLLKKIVVSTSYNQDNNKSCPDMVMIEIIDNGNGIDEDMLANLFTPYVSNKKSGTGLGLSIVKKIAEEHSGKVFASNNTDHGAKITICLPASN
ncbi:MAG: PAS domain-containing sensor histidine kinase [Aquificaceae bacterium]|nr:MAG: PAS domain-containing sensor histidine kinase [Aquificaceae bacterium]